MEARLHEGLPKTHKIDAAFRVENEHLWKDYVAYIRRCGAVNGTVNELELFHVTRSVDNVLFGGSAGGLDPRLKSRRSGSEYGGGVYFSTHPMYGIAYDEGWLTGGDFATPRSDKVFIILALVAVGNVKDFGEYMRGC